MIEALLLLFEMNLDYARRLVADVPDDRLAYQPAPGMNHPAWVLGHLAKSCDLLVTLGGEPPLSPPDWDPLYGNASRPLPDRGAYGSKADLLAALQRGHERAAEVLRGLDPAALQQESPDPIRSRYPLRVHFVIHLLTGHEQMHLGQLSAWRRVQGLPAV